MFVNWSEIEEIETRPGVFRKVFTAGKLQVVQYRYEPGSLFEVHEHPEEQLTIGLQGNLEFEVSGRTESFGPGSIAFLPGDVPHSAKNIGTEEAITLNIFTPPKSVF